MLKSFRGLPLSNKALLSVFPNKQRKLSKSTFTCGSACMTVSRRALIPLAIFRSFSTAEGHGKSLKQASLHSLLIIQGRARALEVGIGDLLHEEETFPTFYICIYKVCCYISSHLVLFVELSWFWWWLDLWAEPCSVSAPPGWCPWWTALLWQYPADSTWTQKPTMLLSLASPEHTELIRGRAACCTPTSHLSLKNLCMPKATSFSRASMTKMNVKT